MRRLQFSPFWKVTRWGFINMNKEWWLHSGPFLLHRACDEYHNKTSYVIIPLVGTFTWWHTTNAGEPHVYARSAGVWDGHYDPDCDICIETVAEVDK